MSPALDVFLKTWRGSAGNERANFQSFLRDFCAATLLSSGEVLVSGGYYNTANGPFFEEILNPTSNRWSPTGRLRNPRNGHSAILLSDGSVLVGFGVMGDVVTEIFQP